MALPDRTSCEQDMLRIIQDIAEIFFSEEFNSLRQELETVYYQANVENAFCTAFKDALFAILAQKEKPFGFSREYGN